MKDKIGYIETKNRKYPICFNLNVMEEIQDSYGSLSKWGDIVANKGEDEPKVKELKHGLELMINEAIDMYNETNEDKQELVNSRQVGRIITEVGFEKTIEILMSLTHESTSTGEETKNE
ncbi:MAG: hypothetical protein IJ068_06845 [Bacilli bacterium]|nr:hypothetical protein [Bacilli bacterium]